MPDILIRVPDSIRCCGECPCFYAEHPMRCQADTHRPKRTRGAPYAGKPDWCPAKEFPPHGDLIDRGAIKTIIENHFKNHKIDRYDRELLLHYLDDEMAPVIVPADKEETE